MDPGLEGGSAIVTNTSRRIGRTAVAKAATRKPKRRGRHGLVDLAADSPAVMRSAPWSTPWRPRTSPPPVRHRP